MKEGFVVTVLKAISVKNMLFKLESGDHLVSLGTLISWSWPILRLKQRRTCLKENIQSLFFRECNKK